jgi:hypothetical protein
MNIFKKELKENLPLDPSNEDGFIRANKFVEDTINGVWPEAFSGAWMNFITVNEEIDEFNIKKYQVIAIYFNDTYPEGTIIESSEPLLNQYPDQYPDAYITWGNIQWQIWEIYVKPGIRRAQVGATLACLAAIYAAQNGKVIQRPDTSTKDAVQLMQFMEYYYADASPYPKIVSQAYRVYTPFEETRLSYAEEMFGDSNG